VAHLRAAIAAGGIQHCKVGTGGFDIEFDIVSRA